MSKIIEYRGCTIQSASRRVGNSEKWRLHIVISMDDIRTSARESFQVMACMPLSRKLRSMGSLLVNASSMGKWKAGL